MINEHAADAIQCSTNHGEIAQCQSTPENEDWLLSESDGCCDTNDGRDYWADDPDSEYSMLWRVETV